MRLQDSAVGNAGAWRRPLWTLRRRDPAAGGLWGGRARLSHRGRRALQRSEPRTDPALRDRVIMRLALIGLLLSLTLAGCADHSVTSDNDRRPVFYGGISGGGSRP